MGTKKPERELRKRLTTNLKKPDWAWTPIESRGVADGVPDLYWGHKPSQTTGWVETKVTEGWTVDLRPHQIGWQVTNAAAGARVIIAVRQVGTDRITGPRDVLWLLDGQYAAHWRAAGLPRVPGTVGVLGRLQGGPRAWGWHNVEDILTGTYPFRPAG